MALPAAESADDIDGGHAPPRPRGSLLGGRGDGGGDGGCEDTAGRLRDALLTMDASPAGGFVRGPPERDRAAAATAVATAAEEGSSAATP